MKTLFTLSLLLLAPAWLVAQSALGTWVTVDDNTGEPRSHIEIYEQGGKLFGKIAKTLDPDAEERCQTCTGKRANQPYLGMIIISAAQPDGSKSWSGGKIYDPEADNSYGLVMWLEDDPNVLFVRGKHWSGFYRTQTWTRLP